MPENDTNQQSMPQHPPSYYRQPKKGSRWWIPVVIIGGILVLIIVLVVAFFGMVASTFESEPVEVKNNSVLYLNFSSGMPEYTKSNPFAELFGAPAGESFIGTLSAIKKAKDDEKINGIYYKASFGNIGFAKAAELRETLLDFKESGKFIYAFIETANENEYINALVADKIVMPKEGIMEMNGFGISGMFFKDLMGEFGIKFHIIQYEDFKSAMEQFGRNNFSDSARVQLQILLNQRYDFLLETIEESRGISKDKAHELISKGMYTADEFLDNKFVDTLMTESDLIELMKYEIFGEDIDTDKEKIKLVTPKTYNSATNTSTDDIVNPSEIAIVYAVGPIMSGSGKDSDFDSDYSVSSGTFIKHLRKVREDDNIKAVIIRIDSPGGSVIASDDIWNEIQKTRKLKPVYASMSDVAASGGYYMAIACDRIFARPETITGSIGVIMGVPNVSGLMDKIHISVDTISTTPAAQFMNGFYSYSEADIARLKSISKGIYDRFINKVAESRGSSYDDIRAIAKGRVWTGKDAKTIGLVDELGGLYDVIDYAKKEIGVPEGEKVQIRFFPEKKDGFDAFMELFDPDDSDGESVNFKQNITKVLGIDAENLIRSWDTLPIELREQMIYSYKLMEIAKKEKVMSALPTLINVK